MSINHTAITSIKYTPLGYLDNKSYNLYSGLITPVSEFYTHGSVHHNSILIRSNKMQQHEGIYLLQNHSTYFGCPPYPSSGVHKTVTAASGTGHSIWVKTFLQRGRWPRWRKVVAQILWPVPEAAVTVLCSPDDGYDGHSKYAEWFCSK